jgi:hypothetical protein
MITSHAETWLGTYIIVFIYSPVKQFIFLFWAILHVLQSLWSQPVNLHVYIKVICFYATLTFDKMEKPFVFFNSLKQNFKSILDVFKMPLMCIWPVDERQIFIHVQRWNICTCTLYSMLMQKWFQNTVLVIDLIG